MRAYNPAAQTQSTGTTVAGQFIRAALVAGLLLGVAGIPSASADTARSQAAEYRMTFSKAIRRHHFDLSQPAGRMALLAKVEKAASDHCDNGRVRADRETCVRNTLAKFLALAPQDNAQAVQLALSERTPVAQAMR